MQLMPDGTLDSSFGSGGYLRESINGGQYFALPEFDDLDRTGKIVIAGICQGDASKDANYCIMRLNPDGTPDTTFANAGKLVIIQ